MNPTPSSNKLRVLVVDDHPMVLQGLRTMLLETGDIDVVAEAADAITAIAVVRSTPLDLVLSDMTLADKTGLVLLQMIKAERPNLPVLMLSMYAEEVFAVRALKPGAVGYLIKMWMLPRWSMPFAGQPAAARTASS
jgi:DNA-binding NarL/FixJ family response regulator